MFQTSPSSKLYVFRRKRAKNTSTRRTLRNKAHKTMNTLANFYGRVEAQLYQLPWPFGTKEHDEVTATQDGVARDEGKKNEHEENLQDCHHSQSEKQQPQKHISSEHEPRNQDQVENAKTWGQSQPEQQQQSDAGTQTEGGFETNDAERIFGESQPEWEHHEHHPGLEGSHEIAGDQNPLSDDFEHSQDVPYVLEDWDPEAEQAIRDSYYVAITDAVEEDFTRGPTRFILSSDGVNPCAGLLMTFDLAQKIKESTMMQREFSRQQRHAKAQSQEIQKFLEELELEVLSHKARISIEESNGMTEVVESLQKEVEMLGFLEIDMQNKQHSLTSNLAYKAGFVAEVQAQVAELLEEAFVVGKLVEPKTEEELPVETFDLQREYQKLHYSLEHPDNNFDEEPMELYESAPVLDTSRDHLRVKQATPTPEEQATQELRATFWFAKDRVEEAQRQFDFKDFDRSQENQVNHQAWYTGEDALDVDQESFDLRWKVRIGEITHELVEAEAALKQARMAAHEAGVDLLLDDQSQCFADEPEDGRHGLGYDASDEEKDAYSAATRDDPRITEWLDNVEVKSESEAKQSDIAEMDDWSCREVDLCDSQSMVAFESSRRDQIDEWQRMCQPQVDADQ